MILSGIPCTVLVLTKSKQEKDIKCVRKPLTKQLLFHIYITLYLWSIYHLMGEVSFGAFLLFLFLAPWLVHLLFAFVFCIVHPQFSLDSGTKEGRNENKAFTHKSYFADVFFFFLRKKKEGNIYFSVNHGDFKSHSKTSRDLNCFLFIFRVVSLVLNGF